jgi:hypothetical protein
MSLQRILHDPENENRILKYEKETDNEQEFRIITSVVFHEVKEKSNISLIDAEFENAVDQAASNCVTDLSTLIANAFIENLEQIKQRNYTAGNMLTTDPKTIVCINTPFPTLEKMYVDKKQFDMFKMLYESNEKISKKYPLLDVLAGKFDFSDMLSSADLDYQSIAIMIIEIFIHVMLLNTVSGGIVIAIMNYISGYNNYIYIILQIIHAIVQALKLHYSDPKNRPAQTYVEKVKQIDNVNVQDIPMDNVFMVFNENKNLPKATDYTVTLCAHTSKANAPSNFHVSIETLVTKLKKIGKIVDEVEKIGYIEGVNSGNLVTQRGKTLSSTKRPVIGIHFDSDSHTLWISHPLLIELFKILQSKNFSDGYTFELSKLKDVPNDLIVLDLTKEEKLNAFIKPFLSNIDLKTALQVTYGWKSKMNTKMPFKYVRENNFHNLYDPIFETFFPNHFIKIVFNVGTGIDISTMITEQQMSQFAHEIKNSTPVESFTCDIYDALKSIKDSHLDCNCTEFLGNFITDYLTNIDVVNHIKESKVSNAEYHLRKMYVQLFEKTKAKELSNVHEYQRQSFVDKLAYNEAFFDVKFSIVGDPGNHSFSFSFPNRKPYYRFRDEVHTNASVMSLYDLSVTCKNANLSSAMRIGYNVMDSEVLPVFSGNVFVRRSSINKERKFTYDLMMITFVGDITQYLIPDWIGNTVTIFDEKHEGAEGLICSSIYKNGCLLPSNLISNSSLVSCLSMPQSKLAKMMEGIISLMLVDIDQSPFKKQVLRTMESLVDVKATEFLAPVAMGNLSHSKTFRSFLKSSRSQSTYDAIIKCCSTKQSQNLSPSDEVCNSENWFEFGKLGDICSGDQLSEIIRTKHELFNNHPCALRFRSIGYFGFGKCFKCKVCRNNYKTSFEVSLCRLGHSEQQTELLKPSAITLRPRGKLSQAAT